MEIRPGLHTTDGWDIEERSFRAGSFAEQGTIFLVGNGQTGYRGTFGEWEADRLVALTVAGTYHTAQEGWPELITAPNPLFTRLFLDDELVALVDESPVRSSLRLDLRRGRLIRSLFFQGRSGKTLDLQEERFASLLHLPLLSQRLKIRLHHGGSLALETGIDPVVWNLHGKHFTECTLKEEPNDCLSATAQTPEGLLTLSVAEGCLVTGSPPQESSLVHQEKLLRRYAWHLPPDTEIIIEKSAAVVASPDSPQPTEQALSLVSQARQEGFKAALTHQRIAWDQEWQRMDVVVEGDLKAQAALRYCLYQNRIATPAHTDRLPLPARGLSCQTYQGAAFWDQEVFNLPVILHTQPESARNLLTFRHRTLPGARNKARRLGYLGAFFPWMSGDSGEELCPSYFFADPLTGRPFRNHFNDWQIHISPDISWAIWKYWEISDDREFLIERGAEILFEVARFLASRLYLRKTTGTSHLVRVLGPDEWHENVDDNAFTNYLARFALEKAVWTWQWMEQNAPDRFAELRATGGFTPDEATGWLQDAQQIALPRPHPDHHLIEQFSGYFELEDVDPATLAARLKHPNEYWGWPAGIAVETQVTKQADVLQLFTMDKSWFEPSVWEANYQYYEPRTSHHSSLSFFAHALVAAWCGRTSDAYRYFMRCATVDLASTQHSVVGGTFIGGIHTAACGAAWQIAVRGFAGCETSAEGLSLLPALPSQWTGMAFPLCWRRCTLSVEIRQNRLRVSAAPGNPRSVPIRTRNQQTVLAPGSTWETEWQPAVSASTTR